MNRSEFVAELVTKVKQFIEALPPDEALRCLFELDAKLYSLQGRKAIEYGGGIHTKHRHMRYHDFFVNRIQKGEKIIDLGCGNGSLTRDIAQKCEAAVIGIDLNRTNLEQARTRHPHPNIQYIEGDVLKTRFEAHFDVIVMSNILEHLKNRTTFLRELVEKIQPGRLLIRVPLFDREWRVPLKKELGVEWRLDLTHETEYTQESFRQEMSEAGLEITHLEIQWSEIWCEVKPISKER